jgi:two-component system, OmpR family, sensor kinase
VSRLSLRARLIVAIGVLLAGALLVFDLSFYAILAHRLERDFDSDLRVSAAEIAAALTPDRHERLDADDVRPGVLEPMSVDDASRPGVYVQILNGSGHTVATSGTRLPIDRSRIRRVLTGLEDLDWVGRDERLRLLSRPVVSANGSVIGVIQVAQSARFLDSSLAAVRMLILVGTTLTLLGSVVAAWLIVGHALQPIGKLTAAANHIVATGRLDARIAPSGPADEVGALVQSFNLMVEQLDGAFERQQQLLADTSHELRNPLTAIRANLEIIESMDGPDEVYEAAAEAKDETIRMSRLVNDLLLLGQCATADAIERKPVDLAALAARLVERARLVSPGHRIDASDVDPVTVMGDADRLQQAVWNLIENAVRCTPTAGTIWVRVRRTDGRVAIQVEDDGPGISPEHQPHVFERLYRVDTARSRRSGGAGLGLAIVTWVAEAHGGSVSLTSVVGEGSCFTIDLPCDREATADGVLEQSQGGSSNGLALIRAGTVDR